MLEFRGSGEAVHRSCLISQRFDRVGNVHTAFVADRYVNGAVTARLIGNSDMLPMRWRPQAELGVVLDYAAFELAAASLATGARAPAQDY